MDASSRKLDVNIAAVLDRIPEAITAVCQANDLADARVRVTVTPPPVDADQPLLLVTAVAIAGYPPELYERGMTVLLCTDYRQSDKDPLAGHKTTSYLPRLLALRTAQQRDCGESIWFTPDNRLTEGCISNIFVVKKGTLTTPPLDAPVLPGVTREAVIELAKTNQIPINETAGTVDDLLDADEVFLTNSIMEVMPVTRIERKPIANERPGEITGQLMNAYRKLVRNEISDCP